MKSIIPIQLLKDFSVENLKTTSSTFLTKFSSEIYLSRFIDYCGSIFTLYLTWGAFSLVCVLSVFFFSFFLSSFFSLFLSVFSLTKTNNSRDRREGRWNHYFLCFTLPPAHKHWFSSLRFLPLLLNRSIYNYKTDSWWGLFSLEIYILFVYSLMELSRSYWRWHFKVTWWGFELVSNYHPSTTKRAP